MRQNRSTMEMTMLCAPRIPGQMEMKMLWRCRTVRDFEKGVGPRKGLRFKIKMSAAQAKRLGIKQELPTKVYKPKVDISYLYWKNHERTSCELRGMLLAGRGGLRFQVTFTCHYELKTGAGMLFIEY